MTQTIGLDGINEIVQRIQPQLFAMLEEEARRETNPLLVWAAISTISFTNAGQNTSPAQYMTWLNLVSELTARANVGHREPVTPGVQQ